MDTSTGSDSERYDITLCIEYDKFIGFTDSMTKDSKSIASELMHHLKYKKTIKYELVKKYNAICIVTKVTAEIAEKSGDSPTFTKQLMALQQGRTLYYYFEYKDDIKIISDFMSAIKTIMRQLV